VINPAAEPGPPLDPEERNPMPLQRRTIAAAGLLAVAVLTACGASTPSKPAADSGGDVPDKPSKAVTLNILDVAGNLQLTQHGRDVHSDDAGTAGGGVAVREPHAAGGPREGRPRVKEEAH
jgi:hypothetical protein